MDRIRRSRLPLAVAALLSLCAVAWAEGIFPVNDPGTGNWAFDQPSVAAYGTILHVAFVGDNAVSGSPDTRLYYAAVNAAANFTNKATTRDQVLLTSPVAIDNGSLYTDARHPQIALRSAKELAILFQAIPAGQTDHKLFRALVTVDNNAVKNQLVAEVRDASGARMSGRLTDPSFAFVAADNSMRVAFSSYPSLAAPSPYADVYYARIGSDNARIVDNTLVLLSKTAASAGTSPLPRLRLDYSGNSHVVWAANNGTTGTPSGIFYAMVKTVFPGLVDNLAIGATQVLSGGYRWGFPNALMAATGNYLWIVAADEPPIGSAGMAGSLGIAEISPYAVTHDGNPVNVNNVGANSLFFINPPGGTVLSPNFDAYHPEAWIDSQSRMHVAGYGFRGALPPYPGTPGRYYAMSLGATTTTSGAVSVFAGMVAYPVSVGLGDTAFAMQLPGDYTRPAFVYFSGKAVHFWSGPDNALAGDAGARNLYVTSTLSSTDVPVSQTQSGCSIVDDPRRGEAGRIPGTVALLLPALLLALRKAVRKAVAR